MPSGPGLTGWIESADFEQVAVGVSEERTNLATPVHRLSEKVSSTAFEQLVGGATIRDPEDHLGAHLVSVGWRREGDRWLVWSWFAPSHKEQPVAKHIEDDRSAAVLSVDRGVKDPDVPVATGLRVGYDEQMSEGRRREALHTEQDMQSGNKKEMVGARV